MNTHGLHTRTRSTSIHRHFEAMTQFLSRFLSRIESTRPHGASRPSQHFDPPGGCKPEAGGSLKLWSLLRASDFNFQEPA